MRIISVKRLRAFWEQNVGAREALESWNAFMKENRFGHPNELRTVFNHIDFIGDGVAIFNIKGNDYRLIVHIKYKWQVIFILWIGTHTEYDRLTKDQIKKMKEPKNKKG